MSKAALVNIATAHLAYAENYLANAAEIYNQAKRLHLEALTLPEDEPAPQPEQQPQPEPTPEPTPEPVPALRKRFYLAPLSGYLTTDRRCTADSYFGLSMTTGEGQPPLYNTAPTSAGTLEELFEYCFGAGNVQGLRWEDQTTVSLDPASPVTHLGILHHGRSQYDEVEGIVE